MSAAKSRGTRRKAREIAVSALYMVEMQAGTAKEGEEQEIIERFFKERGAGPPVLEYANKLIAGVREHGASIDAKIEEASQHWKIARIARIDRNILRVAAYEILFESDVPPRVCIDEAVDIARKYGSEESGAFVNGILDHLKKEKDNL